MINLTVANATEQRVLDFLQKNASDALAARINAGKKTLAGALRYAKDEARKLAKGEGCICVDDDTVFGWIVHFFEEDEVVEPKGQARGTARTLAKEKPAEEPVETKEPVAAKEKPAEPPAKGHASGTAHTPKKWAKPAGPIVMELFSAEELGAKS